MAMKIKNIGKKIIGIGDVTVLPGKTEEIPKTFERSPILEIYKKMGIAEISGKPASNKSNTQGKEADKKAAEKKAAEEAEALRQARLASLEGITEIRGCGEGGAFNRRGSAFLCRNGGVHGQGRKAEHYRYSWEYQKYRKRDAQQFFHNIYSFEYNLLII